MRIPLLYAVLAASLAAGQPLEHLTLDQAVSRALANNAGLLAERASIAIADAHILTAGLRPNPVLAFSGDHMDVLGSGFNDFNGGGPTEAVLGFEFTHERGGKRAGRLEVARAARSVVELRFLDAARALVLDVENGFADALLARDSLELARENSGFLQQIVRINEARVSAGDLARVELIRSRLAALQYEASVRQEENRLRNALIRLQTLMGQQPSAGFSIAGDLDRGDALPLRDELRREAVEKRPDLLALRREAQRASADVRLQMANGRPDFTIGTEYRRQQVNARSNSLTVSFGVPLQIYNRNQGEIERARQEQRQAELRIRALETGIAGEVETAYQQFLAARALLETIRGGMLRQARDVREITELSYRRGHSSLLELLDAQRAFNETMQGYIEARAEYARALHFIDSVSGKAVNP
jgi:outer membrane protein, heavy metal efflux system